VQVTEAALDQHKSHRCRHVVPWR